MCQCVCSAIQHDKWRCLDRVWLIAIIIILLTYNYCRGNIFFVVIFVSILDYDEWACVVHDCS